MKTHDQAMNCLLNQYDMNTNDYHGKTHYVLFERTPNLASYFARSLLKHSHNYASAGDRTNFLASLSLHLETLVKYPG